MTYGEQYSQILADRYAQNPNQLDMFIEELSSRWTAVENRAADLKWEMEMFRILMRFIADRWGVRDIVAAVVNQADDPLPEGAHGEWLPR